MITLYIGSDALLLSGKILDFVALEAEDMATGAWTVDVGLLKNSEFEESVHIGRF